MCLFEGGRLLQILSLRRGANWKRGAYLKLGANSNIYGMSIACLFTVLMTLKTLFQNISEMLS